MEKKKIRDLIKANLRQLPNKLIDEQSNSIARRLFEIDQFKRARRIGLYMNMPHSEVRTMKIIKHCFEMNKEVFLPRCNSDYDPFRKSKYLSFLKVNSLEEVLQLSPQGSLKLLEPVEGEDIMCSGGLDVLILPGVGFSGDRKRLGHGGGYYDEFLTYYQSRFSRKPFLIGIGLTEQLTSYIPLEEHDWRMDCLITPNDTFR